MINSAARAAFEESSSDDLVKNSFNRSPSFLLMSIAGIRMPVPVPSSLIITFAISSYESSIMTASDPPAFSTFLTLVTKVQWPRSTRKIGVKIPSGSPVKSLVKFEREQPSAFDAL